MKLNKIILCNLSIFFIRKRLVFSQTTWNGMLKILQRTGRQKILCEKERSLIKGQFSGGDNFGGREINKQ